MQELGLNCFDDRVVIGQSVSLFQTIKCITEARLIDHSMIGFNNFFIAVTEGAKAIDLEW